VERGYVAAAFLNSDLDPDKYDGFKDGVHGIFDPKDSKRSPDAWGAIAAWAWGASRVMDYFESDKDIDEKHIGVVGHSRGGKAALWCGAEDERFALTISNDSGCTGAALARNKKGERVKRINTVFPHWFCENYRAFNDREEDLPVDQHELIALMAPRLVYVASASLDSWADPEGEFLSCVHAGQVYRLFGFRGVGATKMPKAQQPLHTGHIGHHIRTGKHNLTEYDWARYMDFADKHWK
ncbi:MAG: acetylxylan esterase, partial [Kiritimatiellae bacterium]|nr:acetylxylan esterase [Kiritimatiellia bacterium]